MSFKVWDKQNKEYFEPNQQEQYAIQLKNSSLIYCDLEGVFVGEDGTMVLLDECGNWEYLPAERFEVHDAAIAAFARGLTEGEYPKIKHLAFTVKEDIGYYWIEGEDPGTDHIPDECPACAIRKAANLDGKG